MHTRLLAVVVVAGASLFGLSAPAVAHDQIISSTPENGQLLEAAPSTVSFEFTEDILDDGMGSAIVVLDAAGTDWVAGPLVVDAATVTAPLKPNMPNGVYTVTWRVVSSDGHPVSGGSVFGVGTDPAIQEELEVAAAAVAGSSDEASEAAEPLVTAEARTTDAGADANQTVALVGVGVVVALAMFVGGFAAIRKARAMSQPGRDDSSTPESE